MKVSLIGTNGFLSNCIGDYCNQNSYILTVYGRTCPLGYKYGNFIKSDLLYDQFNYEDIIKSDIIIYAAGGGIQFGLKEDINSIYKLNVSVPITIFNSLKAYDYKGIFVSFGSYFEIGENIENITFNEYNILTSTLSAPNDYTVSKRILTRFIGSIRSSFPFYHFILPTIYGENESQNRLIPYTLKSIYENVTLNLTSGDQVRQYIYIYDAINIIFNAIYLNLKSGIYNVAGVEEFSVKELVSMLFNLMSKELPANIFGKTQRADVGMKILRLNGDKLQESINYKPTTKISDVFDKYNF